MRSFNDIQVYKYTQKGMEESFEIPTNVQNGKKRKKKKSVVRNATSVSLVLVFRQRIG